MADRVLTGLIPTIREALHEVSRELVGLIPAINRNPDGKNLDRAAKGQTIQWPITTRGSLEDITPGQEPANTGNHEVGYGTMTLSNSKAYPILWNGEQQKSLSNGDKPTIDGIMKDEFIEGFATITNQIEADLAALYIKASRSAGAAGILPFGTAGDLSDFAQPLQIMNKNGVVSKDLHMVLGNSSIANARSKQSTLFQVNTSGDANMLRNGAMGRVQGFMIGESNQIAGHTKGTGTSYTSAATGYAIGTTEIPVITGSGTILAGDTITFAGDTNKYIVVDGVAAPGTITIGAPGLLQALPASAVALTIGASSSEQNMFFGRNAIVLQTRMPAIPKGGDKAIDRMTMFDPFSGLTYDIAVYPGYHQNKIEIGLVWGMQVVNPYMLGVLLS